jgi:maltoporin
LALGYVLKALTCAACCDNVLGVISKSRNRIHDNGDDSKNVVDINFDFARANHYLETWNPSHICLATKENCQNEQKEEPGNDGVSKGALPVEHNYQLVLTPGFSKDKQSVVGLKSQMLFE